MVDLLSIIVHCLQIVSGTIAVNSFSTDLCSCSLHGKDFVSLGRHAWRCKRRMNLENEASNGKPCTEELPAEVRHSDNTNINIKCCCRKDCERIRGVKMHQRSCRVMQGLDDELCEKLQDETHNSNRNTSGL